MSDELDVGGEEESGPEGAPAWMATFGDLMSLLLTFFVLLLSFANMDQAKYKQLLESLKKGFGANVVTPGSIQALTTNLVEISKIEAAERPNLLDLPPRPEERQQDRRLLHQLRVLIERERMSDVVEVEASERGVKLRVKGELLFKPGSDVLLPESTVFLGRVLKIARQFPYHLSIEGHTDDLPVTGGRFPSNWHLAAARAIAVRSFFVEEGGFEPQRVSIAAFGDSRPLVPNDTPEHRARNRRVEFVFLRDEVEPPDPDEAPGPPEDAVEVLEQLGAAEAAPGGMAPDADSPEATDPLLEEMKTDPRAARLKGVHRYLRSRAE